MAEQGKRVMDVQTQTSLAEDDKVLIVYNAGNTALAQTALITKTNFLTSNIATDPANSTSLSITKGQWFFSNTFFYVATDTNHVKRIALSDF